MVKLGVNIDHIATLRQQRRGATPNVYSAGVAVRKGGADHLVVHLREDRRHIQDQDVERLAVSSNPFSLEMAATLEMEALAIKIRNFGDTKNPAFLGVCLVPERREELTTEGGLQLEHPSPSLDPIVKNLRAVGIPVSFFIDPTVQAVKAAKQRGADAVELHTGAYAEAEDEETEEKELSLLQQAADTARTLGLHLHAGHGLDYKNVKPVAQIPGMEVLNIGFSIVARALFMGLEQAVREMKELIP